MLLKQLGGAIFRYVHNHNLVYNTCWEDPRLDRDALRLNENDRLVMITSAGCNALDYLLADCGQVFCVDVNWMQNALLELKLAAIQQLDFDDFFQMFGVGWHPKWNQLYRKCLRNTLSMTARHYWDRMGNFFRGDTNRRSFYFRGTSGTFAAFVNNYIDRIARMRPAIDELLESPSVDEQKRIFERHQLKQRIWTPFMRWVIRRQLTMSLLGVPAEQQEELTSYHAGGIEKHVEDCLDAVFTRLPLHDNYFWRVYLTGRYTETCCPEYLKAENFEILRERVGRISVHTCTMTSFLQRFHGTITKFVLLDHMDWLCRSGVDLLTEEWQAIFDRGVNEARIIWRSAGKSSSFVDRLSIVKFGRRHEVGSLLQYDRPLANRLHAQDRVHTYGSFHIAELP